MISVALILAIMSVESGFNTQAASSKQAVGLMQMTSIAVKEVQQTYGYDCQNIWDADTNIDCAILLLSHYEGRTENLKELLATYNGGFRQLRFLRAGQPLAQETAQYIKKVSNRLDKYSDGILCSGADEWFSRVSDALKRTREYTKQREHGFVFERSWWASELREAIRYPSDGVH